MDTPVDLTKLVANWEAAKKAAAEWAAYENNLRMQIFNTAFPNPTEGANNFALPDGRIVNGTHKINRNIEEAVLDDVFKEMREAGDNNPERVVEYKPKLAMKEYRALNPQMAKIFSQAVVATPGTPAVEIKPPPKRGRK